MQRWTYSQYKSSVKSDIEYAMSKRGCLPAQAIGYAHNELVLRLDEYPDETALALVALGCEARALELLDMYSEDDAFIEELLQHLRPSFVEQMGNKLPANERAEFAVDAKALAQILSGRRLSI